MAGEEFAKLRLIIEIDGADDLGRALDVNLAGLAFAEHCGIPQRKSVADDAFVLLAVRGQLL